MKKESSLRSLVYLQNEAASLGELSISEDLTAVTVVPEANNDDRNWPDV